MPRGLRFDKAASESNTDWRFYYIYFGAVPPNRIRAINHIRPL
jgi:hypothetical protein